MDNPELSLTSEEQRKAILRDGVDEVVRRRREAESKREQLERQIPEQAQEGEARRNEARAELKRSKHRTVDEVADIRLSHHAERSEAESAALAHKEAFDAFSRRVAEGRLRAEGNSKSQMVNVDEIAPLELTAPEQDDRSEAFWRHHGNRPEFYQKMAASYPGLLEQLRNGRSSTELAQDSTFGETARFWCGESAVVLDHYRGSYFCTEAGHHRVALSHRHNLGEIPAQVREWRDKS